MHLHPSRLRASALSILLCLGAAMVLFAESSEPSAAPAKVNINTASATELAYLDCLAAVDGLVARKAALDERLSRLAVAGDWWPTVARLRCFRGIDTLTAFVLALEIGETARCNSVRGFTQ